MPLNVPSLVALIFYGGDSPAAHSQFGSVCFSFFSKATVGQLEYVAAQLEILDLLVDFGMIVDRRDSTAPDFTGIINLYRCTPQPAHQTLDSASQVSVIMTTPCCILCTLHSRFCLLNPSHLHVGISTLYTLHSARCTLQTL